MGAAFCSFWYVLGNSFLVWDNLLGWHGSFMGMPQNRVWKARPLCFFRSFWKARNSVAFRDEVLSLQKAKVAFVF